jgi:hypothetical protein
MSQTNSLPVPRDIPSTLEEEYAELGLMNTDRLREELTRSLHVSAAHLRRLAVIVRLLEERGENLADLRIGLLPYLRQIAHGQVLPEVLVRFAQSPWIVRLVSSLPLPDQKKLADGERIELVFRRDTGFDKRLVDPLAMTRDQVLLAFDRNRLRSEEEQVLILEQKKPIDDVVAAIAESRGDDEEDDTDRTKPIMVHLSDAEHQTLKLASTKIGVPMAVLHRRALRAYGLI